MSAPVGRPITTDDPTTGRRPPAEPPDRWLRRFHQGRAGDRGGAPRPQPRLVLLPHAGGAASFYFPLSARLADSAATFAVQYPGRQERRAEPVVTRITELADRVFAVLAAQGSDPPVLFGHSMGAVVGFEVARRWQLRTGNPPAALIVSGRGAPSVPGTGRVHTLDDDGIVKAIRELNGTDAALLADADLIRMILPAVRGDYRAIETYRYEDGPALTCPVTVLIGDADPMVPARHAEAWRTHTSGPFALHTFPGGHFFLVQHQEAVADVIGETLRAVC